MRSENIVLGFIVAAVIVMSVGIMMNNSCGENTWDSRQRLMKELEIGDVYSETYNQNNPYESPYTQRYKIISLSSEFVQYTINDKDTANLSRYWFVTWYVE